MVHAVSAGLAVCAFVVFATRALPRRSGAGSERVRPLGLLGSGALVVGNAASLLPRSPGWYSTTLTVLTVAAAVWLVAALRPSRTARYAPATAGNTAGLHTGSAVGSRPGVTNDHPALYVVDDLDEPVDAEIVDADDEPARTESAPIRPARTDRTRHTDRATPSDRDRRATVTSIMREPHRTVLTREELDARTPDPRRTTAGSTYVAANLHRFVPADRAPRAARGHFTRRDHLTLHADDAAQRRARLLRAYGAEGDLRGRITHHRG